MSRLVAYLSVSAALFTGRAVAQEPVPVLGYLNDSTLSFLAPLAGKWIPVLPDTMLQRLGFTPVAGDYQWTVGHRVLLMREGYPSGGDPLSASVQGMIYWNPATEKVEFVAVGGSRDGEGRLFQGTYRLRNDGTIEREYEVFYRTLADTPAEVFGGSRRRFMETVTFLSPDSVATTLQWWHDGAWRPFGRFATGRQVRSTR